MLAIDSTGEEQRVGGRTVMRPAAHAAESDVQRKNGIAGRWLSINAACQILGVDKSTLRRWSDNGRVPVFRTPGGHRRYSEEDLQAFLAGELVQQRRISRRELAALAHDEIERRKTNGGGAQHPVAGAVGAWADELRLTRDRMIDVSMRYASGRGNADELLQSAHALARDYGRCTATAQLKTSVVVESFLRFRRPLLDALGRYGEQKNLPVRRSCRMIGKLNAYLDVMLTAIVEAHEAHSAE